MSLLKVEEQKTKINGDIPCSWIGTLKDLNNVNSSQTEIQKYSIIAIKILTDCFKFLYERAKAKNHQYIHEEDI